MDTATRDRPKVTVHNLISVDGRIDGFAVDVGLYYELVAALPHRAVLTGSATMLAAAAGQGVDMAVEDEPAGAPPVPAEDGRPWLVVVDSGGRLRRFAWLRAQPYWCDVLVLCSAATPAEHRERLRRHHVDHVVAGTHRVDLAVGLGHLADRYGIDAVPVDAGGGLNGALLRAGLVDEVSLVLAPYLVGHPAVPVQHVVDGISEGRRHGWCWRPSSGSVTTTSGCGTGYGCDAVQGRSAWVGGTCCPAGHPVPRGRIGA